MAESSRAIAARIMQQVAAGRSLSDTLPRQLEAVSSRQRPLIQELCYGGLRWYPRLDALAVRLLKRPLKPRDGDVRALILLGLYQLLYLRVAAHAAVAETVEAVRALGKPWAAGLVNGVLRRFQREQADRLAALESDPVAHYAHPQWLLKALQAAWPGHWQAIVEAANRRPPMSLRVNLRQGSREEYVELLAGKGFSSRSIPGTPAGLVLEQPLEIMELPGFTAGRVSVQDGGAQLAAGLLELRPGQRVLDACAAPGGKACHILETEPRLASLTAIDADAERLGRVEENLRRLGLEAELYVGDAGAPSGVWSQRCYDRILLDVPCSATGVIRRHPDIKLLRRETDIPALATRQARMLDAMWPLLAPGGMLLYATCSLLPEENQSQVANFLARRNDAREHRPTASWGHACTVGCQILPGEQMMDGFYYACLEKR